MFELGKRQQTAVSVAITILAAAVIVTAVLTLGRVVSGFVEQFSSVFLPLAVAGVGALVFKPYYELLRDRVRLGPSLAVGAVFLSAVVPLFAFAWFFGSLIVEQIGDLALKAPQWWNAALESAQERWPQVKEFFSDHPLGRKLKEIVTSQQGKFLEGLQIVGSTAWSAGAVIVRSVFGLLGWVVTPVYFAFFLMAETRGLKDLDDLLPFLKPETRADVIYLVEEFVTIIVAFFRGQLIIAFVQGLLFAIGFSAVGLKSGFVLGLMLGFLNVIPYLGSLVGLGIALPLAFFQPDGGGMIKIIAVLVVFTVVQMIEGYVLTPKIMGERTGLHPMAIIVAVFFWGSALGGILGMILAIPLTAFLVVFWRLAKEKYVSELV